MGKRSVLRGALLSLAIAGLSLLAPVASAQPAAQPAASAAAPADPAAPAAAAPPATAAQAAPAPPPNYSNVKNEWHEGDPLPPGYHAEKEVFVPLVMAGGIELGTSWLTLGVLPGAVLLAAGVEAQSSTVDCDSCIAGGATLLVPGVGPFLTMVVLGANGETEPVGYVLLTVDGLIQGAGLGMLIAGLVMQRDVLVRDRAGQADLELKPVLNVGPGGGNVGLSGTF